MVSSSCSSKERANWSSPDGSSPWARVLIDFSDHVASKKLTHFIPGKPLGICAAEGQPALNHDWASPTGRPRLSRVFLAGTQRRYAVNSKEEMFQHSSPLKIRAVFAF